MKTVNYSNLVDQFYYDGYSAFSPEREVEEEADIIPGVFVNGRPARREDIEDEV